MINYQNTIKLVEVIMFLKTNVEILKKKHSTSSGKFWKNLGVYLTYHSRQSKVWGIHPPSPPGFTPLDGCNETLRICGAKTLV